MSKGSRLDTTKRVSLLTKMTQMREPFSMSSAPGLVLKYCYKNHSLSLVGEPHSTY